MDATVTLRTLLARNALHFRDQTALLFDGRALTHAQLFSRANRLGAALVATGVRRQDRVAILSMNTIAYMEIAAASWCAGIILATVNYRLTEADMSLIINDASPRVLFFSAEFSEAVRAIRGGLPSVTGFVCIDGEAEGATAYEAFIAGAPQNAPSGEPAPEDIANLVYTSGTTGRPKGCINTHRASVITYATLALTQGGASTDRLLCVMPLFHIGAINLVMSVLFTGGSVLIHRSFDAAQVVSAIAAHRVSIVLLAPTMVELVLEQPEGPPQDLASLRKIVYSASPMPSRTLRRAIERFGPIVMQYYGQTELATSFLPAEMHLPDGTPEDQALLLSAGIPLPGITLRIVDATLRICVQGEAGEVLVKSMAGFGGYWNNHAATLDATVDGWFRTGDIGRLDERGFLYLLDRKKDLIISGGENIYCREVEEALIQHPAVAEVAVFGVPDPIWGEAVAAIVVCVIGEMVSAQELIAHTRGRLAGYKKPRHIVFAPSLAKLASGKIDKKALRAAYSSRLQADR